MDYPQGTAIRLTERFTVQGTLTDPTVIVFHVLWPDGSEHTYEFGVNAEVTHASTGVYYLTLDPPAEIGTYIYWGVGTGTVDATSKPRSFNVVATLGDASTGPCELWVTAAEVQECCVSSDSSADYQEATEAASQVLYALVPRFSGTCGPLRVRPCGSRACGSPWLAWQWGGSSWIWPDPWQYPAEAAHASGRDCGCRALSRVRLAGHVREVLEVTIDGAVIDDATWRLDGREWLVRLPDPADPDTRLFWPSCQNMEADETADSTFSVLYTFGVDPPVAGRLAARELACAIFQTCEGGGSGMNADDCPLPNNVTRIVRQGITLDLQAFTGWGFNDTTKQWQTGMPLVDMFLNAYNPQGRRRRRSYAWSPDLDRPAQKLGT